MKTPTTSSKIKKKWVQYLLEQYLSRSQPLSTAIVEVKNFTVTSNEIGLGFNYELVSLDVEASLKEGDSDPLSEDPTPVEYHLKAKFHSTEPFVREINKRIKSDIKEHIIYSEVIEELNDLQASNAEDQFRISIPELIYGKYSENEYVLIMENVKAKGYELCDKYKGLDLAHLQVAADQIAKFHALSHAYSKMQNLTEKYPFFKFDEAVYHFVIPTIETFLEDCIELLIAKEKPDIAKRLGDSKSYVIGKASPLEMHKGEEPTCLVHGDYWNNNIMFKHEGPDEENQTKVVDCKIVDWGNVVWGQPLYDLQCLIYTSTTLETRKNHMETILQQYYNTFTEVTSKMGFPVTNWSYEDYLKEWKRLGHVGLVFSLLLVAVNLTKKNVMSPLREPSWLDHPFCLPTQRFVKGVKLSMAKMMVPLMYSARGAKMFKSMSSKMLMQVRDEMLSGNNEILTTRIIDLLCEADKRGLFTE